jgi:hypothetical protein
MSKNNKWSKFMETRAKRSGIAFGIAVMAIGYNMLPIKPPLWLSEIAGLVVLLMGAWVVTVHIGKKTK